jgi:hypothetical protein
MDIIRSGNGNGNRSSMGNTLQPHLLSALLSLLRTVLSNICPRTNIAVTMEKNLNLIVKRKEAQNIQMQHRKRLKRKKIRSTQEINEERGY